MIKTEGDMKISIADMFMLSEIIGYIEANEKFNINYFQYLMKLKGRMIESLVNEES